MTFLNSYNNHKKDKFVSGNSKLCYYRNAGAKLQQIVINGAWEKEKIIFPGEQLLFWANPQDQLTVKILKSEEIIVDSIICEHLLVD